MELLIAFGTDDGENLKDDHVGMAKFYDVYKFLGDEVEFLERRENLKYESNKSIKHGDPEKARKVSSVLEEIDVLVGKKFGPNLPRLSQKLVCVIIRRNPISDAIKLIKNNMDKIITEKNKEVNRKHIVFNPV